VSDAPHGTVARHSAGCRCDPCRDAVSRYVADRYRVAPRAGTPMSAEERERVAATRAAQVAATRAEATSARRPWTADDLTVALDYSRSAVEAARMLGRSQSAVAHARQRYGPGRPEVLPYRERPARRRRA